MILRMKLSIKFIFYKVSMIVLNVINVLTANMIYHVQNNNDMHDMSLTGPHVWKNSISQNISVNYIMQWVFTK